VAANASEVRLTLRQAAARLGVSESAIRKRAERGTFRSELGTDGRRYVYLPNVADTGTDNGVDMSVTHERDALISSKDETISVLQEQLEAERQAHGEARRLLAAALERIPALEPPREHTADAPPEPSRARESAPEGAGSGDVPPKAEIPAERRSWWRRWLRS